jgi:SAM-dependent methyltransferase
MELRGRDIGQAIKSRVRLANSRLVGTTNRFGRALFYQLVFGRKVPFASELTKVVSAWERKKKKGDIPVKRDVWEALYLRGTWDYMNEVDELARYSVITGYLQFLRPKSAILDVGCGEGILFRRYRPYGYSRYVGIDISQVAIDRLCREQDHKTHFIAADVETYVPQERFDVIVFNEALYYFHDPLEVIGRYTVALKEDGVVVVSTYAGSHRALSILRQVKNKLSLVDEVVTTHGSTSWVCSVFTASKTARLIGMLLVILAVALGVRPNRPYTRHASVLPKRAGESHRAVVAAARSHTIFRSKSPMMHRS